MSFGDVIRSASSPDVWPLSIGGDSDTIWHCSRQAVRYELSTTDFSVIRNVSTAPYFDDGIGGDNNTIWNSFDNANLIREISTSDLSVIRSEPSPSLQPRGAGGDTNTIWHTDIGTDQIYELNTSDFSVIRSASTPVIHPRGVGGDANVIWYADTGMLYELSVSDFSVIQSVLAPYGQGMGVGGSVDVIWFCEYIGDLIYELDAAYVPPTYTISGNVKDSDGNNLNNVTITLEDGTNYSTSTNINGNYSQLVDPDVYTVTASLTGYLDSSVSVNASAGDQIQDFILLRPVISGNVKDSGGNNLDNVTITLENGVDYSTNTNINGNYSQSVTSDIYTVTASLAGYLDSSASVDASSANQTQNFTLLKPVISGNVQNSNGINLPSVAISLEDDTNYSTTTDVNGDYSQTVDPDVYAVVASIPGNADQSASVDASTADQTQNFIFPITTAPHDKGIRLIERYLMK